ncbi:MAG: prepilin-type N-terminal cleavage/methylation domain-containing protein [bacterium]
MSHKRGFTLVELMVVIGIIAILAGIVMTSLSSAKYRANDTKRKSDLKNLALSLSVYYNDNNAYPSTGNTGGSSCNSWWGNTTDYGNKTNYIPGLAPAYTNTSALPQDPQLDGTTAINRAYLYCSDGQSYKLIDNFPANSQVASTPTSDEFYDPARPTWSWMVCSGATACSMW